MSIYYAVRKSAHVSMPKWRTKGLERAAHNLSAELIVWCKAPSEVGMIERKLGSLLLGRTRQLMCSAQTAYARL